MTLRAILKKLKMMMNANRKVNSKSNVILPIRNSPGKYVFYCPGCEDSHVINTDPRIAYPYHTLKGNLHKPTIRASVLSKGDLYNGKPHCHSFVTKGKIHFLNDSTHKLAGKVVSLRPL
ncbi:MAG: anaerobic dehydrogenase [Verrucomicrobia bacterium]|nr:anaerobic dehydrogenase [Verrucomicrobiota bacterium]